jgi:uncharacterized protein (DUF1697 family)
MRGSPEGGGIANLARYVALLRGINLGKQNRVPMTTLREMLADLGYSDIATHLQSGNAVFTTGRKSAQTLAGEIESRIERDLGLDIAVVVVSAADLAAIVDANPLATTSRDPAKLMVVFLWKQPRAAALRAIDPDEYAPEEFAVGKRAIYLWLPNGTQGSKLVGALTDTKLGVTATVRAWRTVTKLVELAAE